MSSSSHLILTSVVVGLGEEIVLNLSMIIMLNFPTLITDSSLYSTSNHVNDLLSLNVFVNLQQLILEHLGHDAFDSLEEGTGIKIIFIYISTVSDLCIPFEKQ